MKILFKVWNVLMLIGASATIIVSVLAVLGVGSFGAEIGGGGLAGLALMTIMIKLLPSIAAAVLTFIAAKAGVSGDYDKCAKFGTIILVLNLIGAVILIVQGGFGSKEAMSVIASGIYVFLAKRM